MVGSEFVVDNMKASCLASTGQATTGDVIVWSIYSWHTSGTLVPIKHYLNITGYLRTLADHVQCIPLILASSANNLMLLSWTWQQVHCIQTVYTNGPDRNPGEHLRDVMEWETRIMDMQPTNLQEPCDAIKAIWTTIPEKCFQHLVEFMQRTIKDSSEDKKAVRQRTTKVYLTECMCPQWHI